MCRRASVEVRGHLAGVGSPLPSTMQVSRTKLRSSGLAAVPLPTEPPFQPPPKADQNSVFKNFTVWAFNCSRILYISVMCFDQIYSCSLSSNRPLSLPTAFVNGLSLSALAILEIKIEYFNYI